MSVDELWPSALAVGGGFFMGTYPIFVKAPQAAGVHPVVFRARARAVTPFCVHHQLTLCIPFCGHLRAEMYKSVWVAVTGALLVGLRMARGASPTFVFSWWAVASACAWVPAGLCLIAAVPRAGVGGAVLIFDGTTTLVSFVAFVAVFHEPIKSYPTADGGVYYLAPYYLGSALCGMGALIYVPRWLSGAGAEPQPVTVSVEQPRSRAIKEPLLPPAPAPPATPTSMRTLAAGYGLACCAGILSAVQYGVVARAKAMSRAGSVPAEAIDTLGSWTLTFGGAAAAFNALCLAALWVRSGAPAHSAAVVLPGCGAGLCYCVSILLTTMAVQAGGDAVTLAQRTTMSLVTSGAWGLLWFREVRGIAALGWVVAAALTMASVVMLSLEKAG